MSGHGIVAQLRECVAGAVCESDAVSAATDLLTCAEIVADAVANLAETLRAAEEAQAELEALVQALQRRLPVVAGGGFHSGGIDPRGIVLISTSSAIRNGALYLPSELRELATNGRIEPWWHVQAALRFVAFAAAFAYVLDRLERRALPAKEYVASVTNLAARFSAIPFVAEPVPGRTAAVSREEPAGDV